MRHEEGIAISACDMVSVSQRNFATDLVCRIFHLRYSARVAIASCDTAVVSQMAGPDKGESGAGRREQRKVHAGEDANGYLRAWWRRRRYYFMAQRGLLLNCVSGGDQASDRGPEEEISDSPPGIGTHPGGKRR